MSLQERSCGIKNQSTRHKITQRRECGKETKKAEREKERLREVGGGGGRKMVLF
jgi:hypothetical protein